jgi:thiamine-phosphate pyrophosphorylase
MDDPIKHSRDSYHTPAIDSSRGIGYAGRVRGLYAIVDLDFLAARRVPALAFVDALLDVPPCALQLRAKSSGGRETLELLRAIQVRCAQRDVPLFCNDRPDLAVLAGCAGVHLGQTDLAIADTRKLAPELAIGVSTHGLEQLEAALRERPSYVALGPIFPTGSKPDAEPVVGLAILAEASQRCRAAGVPLVAIGGVSLERAALIGELADAGASISALLPAGGLPDVTRVAGLCHSLLGGRARPVY